MTKINHYCILGLFLKNPRIHFPSHGPAVPDQATRTPPPSCARRRRARAGDLKQ